MATVQQGGKHRRSKETAMMSSEGQQTGPDNPSAWRSGAQGTQAKFTGTLETVTKRFSFVCLFIQISTMSNTGRTQWMPQCPRATLKAPEGPLAAATAVAALLADRSRFALPGSLFGQDTSSDRHTHTKPTKDVTHPLKALYIMLQDLPLWVARL